MRCTCERSFPTFARVWVVCSFRFLRLQTFHECEFRVGIVRGAGENADKEGKDKKQGGRASRDRQASERGRFIVSERSAARTSQLTYSCCSSLALNSSPYARTLPFVPPANAWPDSLIMGFSPDDPPRTLPLDDGRRSFTPSFGSFRHIGGTKLNFGAPSDRIVSDLKPCFQFLSSSSRTATTTNVNDTNLKRGGSLPRYPVRYDTYSTRALIMWPPVAMVPPVPPFRKKCAHISCAVSDGMPLRSRRFI